MSPGPTGLGEGVNVRIFSLGKEITSLKGRQPAFVRQRKRQGRRNEPGDTKETENVGNLARGRKRNNIDMI